MTHIRHENVSIGHLPEAATANIVYSDEDIVVIDNVKTLAIPSDSRLSMNVIVVITAGRIRTLIDDEYVDLDAEHILIGAHDITFTDIMSSPDFKFKAIFFTNKVLHSFLRENISVWNSLVYDRHVRVIRKDDSCKEFYQRLSDLIVLWLNVGIKNAYHAEIVQALQRVAFLGLCGDAEDDSRQMPVGSTTPAAYDKLFREFLILLDSEEIRHRQASYYAEKLNVSPKYLSAVCRRNSGKTASQWMDERLQSEVRFALEKTEASVKQICYRLGFSSPSFFGKYVKLRFGMTPLEIREKANYGRAGAEFSH